MKRKLPQNDVLDKRRKWKCPGVYQENFGSAPPARTKIVDYRSLERKEPGALADFCNSLHVHGYAYLKPGKKYIMALKEMKSIGRKLFELSEAEKQRCSMREFDSAGYSTDGFTKEIYMATSPSTMPDRLCPSNSSYRKAINNFFDVSYNVVVTLLHSLALSLNCRQGEDCFSRFLRHPTGDKDCLVKIIKYLNKRKKENTEQKNALEPNYAHIMLSEHFDVGLLTLSYAKESGLMVYDRSCGVWVFAEKGLVNGEIVVLSGSQLQFLTRDYFPATLHAVVATSSRPRFSHIFFARGEMNASPPHVLDPKALKSNVVDEIKGETQKMTIEQLYDEYLERNNASLKLRGLAA